MATVIKLHGVQDEIDKLLLERDVLIRELKGIVGVNELARFIKLSAGQVSRIQNNKQRRI
jgi:hypothetical protein